MKIPMTQDQPLSMAETMAALYRDSGDDFYILRDTKGRGGQIIVKSAAAMDALEKGIEQLRKRKSATGVYTK